MTVTRTGPGMATLIANLAQLEGIQGKTGWFETAQYPGVSVAYVATIQEFGTDKIPPRPFMRPAVADDGAKWLNTLRGAAAVVLTGGMSASDAMELTTLQAAGDVAKHIVAVTSPALAEATLKNRARRGNKSSKPLEDTKQMLQSVTGKVEAAGSE